MALLTSSVSGGGAGKGSGVTRARPSASKELAHARWEADCWAEENWVSEGQLREVRGERN